MCLKIDISPEDINSGSWVNKFQSTLEQHNYGYFELNPELYSMLSKSEINKENGYIRDYFMTPEYQSEESIVESASCGCYGCIKEPDWKPFKKVVILGSYLSPGQSNFKYLVNLRSNSNLDPGVIRFFSNSLQGRAGMKIKIRRYGDSV